MGETKFTPGPWRYEDYDGRFVYARTGETICEIMTNYEREDGHLIAAAPDLYEVVAGLFSESDNDEDWRPAARAALAKARGEA